MNKKMPNKIYTRGSQLDCETEKGAYFIDKQYSTTNILKNKYPSLIFKHRKLKTAGEDCYVYHNNKLSAVSEIKCRPYINRDKKIPFTFEILKNRYKNEYLITAEKLYHLQSISKARGIPSFVFFDLPSESCIVRLKITDSNGEFVTTFEERETMTKYSCNDEKGDTVRLNAFIPIDTPTAEVIKY